MSINLLHMIKDLTRDITPAFALGMSSSFAVRKRQMWLEILNHLVFIQSQ